VLDTLPFTDEPRASDRAIIHADVTFGPIAAVELLRQCLEALDRLWLQAAVRQLLDSVGKTAAPKLGSQVGGSVSKTSRHWRFVQVFMLMPA
jgi:hypothetical protein